MPGVHIHRGEDHVKRQREGCHLQASGASEKTKPADNLTSDFQPLGRWENQFRLFKPPSLDTVLQQPEQTNRNRYDAWTLRGRWGEQIRPPQIHPFNWHILAPGGVWQCARFQVHKDEKLSSWLQWTHSQLENKILTQYGCATREIFLWGFGNTEEGFSPAMKGVHKAARKMWRDVWAKCFQKTKSNKQTKPPLSSDYLTRTTFLNWRTKDHWGRGCLLWAMRGFLLATLS